MDRGATWVALAIIGLAAGSTPARAGETRDLEAAVQAQGEVIQELRGELDRVRQDQQRSQDRIHALEDKIAAGTSGEDGVTPGFVDRRIQQFDSFPDSRLYISGYGTAQYQDTGAAPGTFGFSFNPIFHFMLTDRLHFDSELEIALENNETNIELEIGQIDYLVNDWLTLSAGKFLLPFNVFGPKLHPSWINKLPTLPPFYRHGEHPGGFIPVMSDIGAMASGGFSLFDTQSKLNYALYAANGPATPGLDELAGMDEAVEENSLDFRFENWPDENQSKSVGGRLGFLPIPNLEVGASFLTGETKGAGRATLFGLDAWYHVDALELRAEYARLARTASGPDESAYGYYVQAAYRLRSLLDRHPSLPTFVGRLEPVVRWGEVGGFAPLKRRQLALGLDYWLFESVPIKIAYELNSGEISGDGFFIQLSYGF
jgi:hypothetical protein